MKGPRPFATLATMRNTWLFALLLWLYVLPTARSQDRTPHLMDSGNAFLSLCGDTLDDSPKHSAYQQGECLGYVIGVWQGLRMAYDLEGVKQFYCPPDEVTNGQTVSILLKFIKDHPEKAHLETRLLEGYALMDAFPCKPAKKKPATGAKK